MKITFVRQALLSAITQASAATPARTPKDVLRNILLTGKGTLFEVIGTDQEIGIRARLPEEAVISTESQSPVEVLLQPQRIRQILSEITDGHVTLDVEDGLVRVISSNAKFKLSTEDPKEFPPVPGVVTDDVWSVALPNFVQAVKRTEFAYDAESTRYALGGIHLEITEGKELIFAATDSRRLSVATVSVNQSGNPTPIKKTTVVPAKAWKAISAACASGGDTVEFVVSDNDVTFKIGLVSVYTRLVEGRFPRYRDVIPQRCNAKVSIPCAPLFSALRQSLICLDKEDRAARITFDKGVVKIASASAAGESAVEFPVDYSTEKICVSVDPTYITDLLRVLPPEQLIEFRLISPDDAIVMHVGDSLKYVVMPLAQN